MCWECNHGFIWKGERKNPTFSCVIWRINPTCTCYRKSVREQELQNSILQYLQKMAQIVLGQEDEKRNWEKEEILRLERQYQEEMRLQKEEEKSDRYRLEEYMPFQVLTRRW